MPHPDPAVPAVPADPAAAQDDTQAAAQDAAPRLLVRWFVQYNPTFTASALCVLGGVLLLARALGPGGDLPLALVLELYQALLIGVAALLYRRLHEHRPAVILGVIALVFLVDPTLQLAAHASAGRVVAPIAWIALFAAKWRALEYAFRLRLSWSARVMPPVVAGLVAFLPHARLLDLFAGPAADGLPVAFALVIFVVGAATALSAPRATSLRALGGVGQEMFPRLQRAAVAIGAAGVVYQCANAVLAIGPGAVLPALGALALVGTVATRSEGRAWALALAGHVLCASGGVLALALVSSALLLASRRHPPRVMVGGIMVAVVGVVGPAVFFGAPAPALKLALVAGIGTLALGYLALRRRAWSARVALAALHGPWLVVHGARAAPQDPLAWGALLLGAGFVLLPLGVVLHRRLSRIVDVDAAVDGRRVRAGAPSSCAAPARAL